MKLSLQVHDNPNQNENHHSHQQQTPVLIRAKLPITILNLPFLSIFSTSTANHNPCLSLRTNFSSGPSLKLSYNPTSQSPPLSFTLKSGTSPSGSPNNSPLVISAHFSLNPLNISNPNPSFSLLFKPRLGDFSLRKSVDSSPPNPAADANVKTRIGFLEREHNVWKELRVGDDVEGGVFKGVLVMANTKIPVAKQVGVSLRWGVGFREGFGKGMPVLSVNKVGIERVVEEVKEVGKEEIVVGNAGKQEEEVLKGMVGWMRRELDVLHRENREMRRDLEEMRVGTSVVGKNSNVVSGGGKGGVKNVGTTTGFEKWKSKKNGGGGEEMGKEELSKVGNTAVDVQSELQRAIMAASSSS